MPELPEVETIRRDLAKKIINKKIIEVKVWKKKIVKTNLRKFVRALKNNSIFKISRRGKLLIFGLKDQKNFLLIHLKMTGQLIYQKGSKIIPGGHGFPEPTNDLPSKHTHLVITFSDKSRLFFNDLRQFGYAKIVNTNELEKIFDAFGVEPLTSKFTIKRFEEVIDRRSAPIKAVLLNQSLIAGIGNIYADETCYQARIKPSRKAKSLTKKEIAKLFLAIKHILSRAVSRRGTTFSNYVDGKGKPGNYALSLKVYEREGKKCLRCSSTIAKKQNIAGRGTRYCPSCQK